MNQNILYVGSFRRDFYDSKLVGAFINTGAKVTTFEWKRYFSNYEYKNILYKAFYGAQNRFKIGPSIRSLNQDFIELALKTNPDFIFINRGLHIKPKTLAFIRSELPNVKLIGYNNDSPFSHLHPKWLFNLHLASVKNYDAFFCYRKTDQPKYEAMGCKKTFLLYPYYVSADNFQIPNTKKVYDVSFIGHYEKDGRDKQISYLLENNINVHLKGTGWNQSNLYANLKSTLGEITPVYGHHYNAHINKSKICLVFLSRINSDTYTRRCFEIPATGTFMLSKHSEQLEEWFTEGKEAEYFRSKEELLEKAMFYLKNEKSREKIALAGKLKLLSMKHEIADRAQEIQTAVKSINNICI